MWLQKKKTPRYAPQFGSRLHFKRCQALPKETPFPFFSGTPFFGTPFFFFFLSPAKVGSLEMQPGAKLQAYLGVIILQPHACTQRFRLRVLRRTRSNAGRTSARTQAAIAGALLAHRTGPDQDVFTTNQITSALVAYRSAADQDTATASSIAAALLSYYTIAQVDGLLAGKLGVTEAALALQIAVRFPGPTRSRSWAPRTSRCQTGRFAPAATAPWSWPRTPRE